MTASPPPPAPTPAGASQPGSHPEPGSPVGRFIDLFRQSLANDSFVRLALTAPTPITGAVERVLGRVVKLKDGTVFSLTERQARRDTTRNLPLADAPAWLEHQLGLYFRGAYLGTRSRDWQLTWPEARPPRLVGHAASSTEPADRSHDRPKQQPLAAETSRDWLQALGLADRSGRVLPSRAAKHHQILRYAELLRHFLRDIEFPTERPPRAIDMGCGKGYLTFAAWHLLRRELQVPAEVSGIEVRPELAAAAESVARRLQLDGLRFTAGTIANAALEPGAVDVLIALHACNTATDDALRRGIELGARLIVVAPCCHQEIRPVLGKPEPLAPVLAHGLMAERFAEWVTDGLRALHLEWAGYRTKIVEFVGSEHTPKNLLLAATRDPARTPFADSAAGERLRKLVEFCGLPPDFRQFSRP